MKKPLIIRMWGFTFPFIDTRLMGLAGLFFWINGRETVVPDPGIGLVLVLIDRRGFFNKICYYFF